MFMLFSKSVFFGSSQRRQAKTKEELIAHPAAAGEQLTEMNCKIFYFRESSIP